MPRAHHRSPLGNYILLTPPPARAVFLGGVGKFFEGTAEDMEANIYRTICRLPEDTSMFCGHEYAVPNLAFAQWVEPDNDAVRGKASEGEGEGERERGWGSLSPASHADAGVRRAPCNRATDANGALHASV